MMIQGAVFDADGTLLDSTQMWANVGELFLSRLGIQAAPGLSAILFPMSLPDATDYLIHTYGLTLSQQEVTDRVNTMVGEFYSAQVRLKPGVRSFLRELQARGVPMTVATATDRVAIEKGLSRTGIEDYFQEIFTCTEVGIGKEAPDVYLAAAERMGTAPDVTWVFEDALHGAETAKAAGFRVAAVYDPVSARHQEALRQIADVYLPDLRGADQFFQTICRLN